MREELLRTASLIGENGIDKLSHSAAAVFGIGGVGSYAAEALVRSGLGTVYIYDNDTVAKSNINRQLIALNSTVGKNKTDIAAARYRDINPECNIIPVCEFITPESEIPFEKFNVMIDAVDNVTAKLFLAEQAYKRKNPPYKRYGNGQ